MALIEQNAFRGLRGFLQAGRIHRVRSLHSKVQKSFLWELTFYDAVEDFKFLATEVGFPGISNKIITYLVGGVEQYYLGEGKRGGLVQASFVELEGSPVDRYFRAWMNESTDVSISPLGEGQASEMTPFGWLRRPRNAYEKTATVILKNRLGSKVASFKLLGLIPAMIHEYRWRYEDNSFVTVKVDLYCNEVRRLDVPGPLSIRLPTFE